jgi:hypothetical protein
MYNMYPNFNAAPHSAAPHLIGLSGYATSGKDSVAEVLTRLYGYQRVAFADKLKEFVREINPYVAFPTSDKIRATELVDALGDAEAKKHEEYRRVLQAVGTKARAFFGEDVWVDAAFVGLEPEHHYVFSDVRFKNEARVLQEEGGIVLRVQRPGVGPANDHISEHDLDDWPFDGYIVNDGSLLDLEGEVQRVLGDLG